jgi:atypical dual specificity phosphatase
LTEAFSANIEGEEPKNKVLVHCFAGKSRATSFTLCYMIKERKIGLKEGLELIWKVRPIAAPNPGFMVQLKALERAILGCNTEVDIM